MVRFNAHQPFCPTDRAFLRLVAPLIGQALHAAFTRERARASLLQTRCDVTGVLLLSPDNTVKVTTPAAETWLNLLREREQQGAASLPTAVLSALASLHTRGHHPLTPVVLVPTPVGVLRVEASRTSENSLVAITLAPQPAFTPLQVPSDWPLTRQERKICELLLHGKSSRQIA